MEIILYIIGGLVVFSAIRGWMGAGVPMLRSQAEVARGAGTWKLGDTTYHLTSKEIGGEWKLVYADDSKTHQQRSAFGIFTQGQKLSAEYPTPRSKDILESYVREAVGNWSYDGKRVKIERITLPDGSPWLTATDEEGRAVSPVDVTTLGQQLS